MLVAAIYDIHANLPALEAVLEEIRQVGADHVVVGGDVLPGPMPRETLTYLLDLGIPVQFIYGNGEIAVLEQMAGKDPATVPEHYRPVIRWTAQQLRPEYEGLLARWPKTVTLGIPGIGEVLFCHATLRNENEIFTRLTPEERLLPILEALNVSAVVCGHTHMQFDRMVGTVRVVNAGSVGECRSENRALTGSYLGRTSNFTILATISRRLPSKFETQAIRKPTTLLPITSCNRPPRRKCLTYLPARN